jgi:hypothetical protein
MPTSKAKPRKPADRDKLLALMEPWARSWRGSDDDIPIGEGLVAVMRPFIEHLCDRGLVHATVRDHLDNCWVIGGEIIRDVWQQPKRRSLAARRLVLDAIANGDAPLVDDFDEQGQRRLDATAKKLFRFLTADDQD